MSKVITDKKIIDEVLDRWVDKVYPSKEDFKKALKSRKKLVIYHGVDPTAPHLHLGHSTNYLLLRKFQDSGHKIILLIGDFTAQIGDPTGRLAARKALTQKEVMENCKTYQNQIGKILDFKSKKNPAKLKFNSQWLGKLKLEDIMKIAANFTQAQIIKRNMFQERLKKEEEIYLHEFLYPLFQGYDSVALNVDVEVGGTDQTFNMLIGRDLLKIYKKKEKFVLTTPLLINSKTGQKLMSKSEGDFIALDDFPNQMYGKIMALPDEVIITCFELCTEMPAGEIQKIKKELTAKKLNPRDAKARLAREIVNIYHGKAAAQKAEKEFNRVFKEKQVPSRVTSYKLRVTRLSILDLLVKTKLAPSKAEAKRLVMQRGVKIDGKVVGDWQQKIAPKKGAILQVGKRRFVKMA